VIDRSAQERTARGLLEKLGRISTCTRWWATCPGRQQIVEICRALAREVRVLLMDEPTSALSPGEIHVLFRAIRDLRPRASHRVHLA